MSDLQTISTEDLKQRLAQDDALHFWNVLTDEYFRGKMIPGSRRVPLGMVDDEVTQIRLPKDAEVIVYCAGPACPQGRIAAEKLAALGYTNVRFYEGGVDEWTAAGFGIVVIEQTVAA